MTMRPIMSALWAAGLLSSPFRITGPYVPPPPAPPPAPTETSPVVAFQPATAPSIGRIPTAVTASNRVALYNDTTSPVIENLVIWHNGTEPALELYNTDNATIRNCLILHSNGHGVSLNTCAGTKIENVWVFNYDAPESGPLASERLNFYIHASPNTRAHRVRCDRGSSGFWVNQSTGVHLSQIEGHDFRGPFPRGQLVQFTSGSNNCILEDFSCENPVGTSPTDPLGVSWPEDCVNLFASTNATIRRGLIDGNNSSNGWAVIFDGGYNDAGASGATGLVEDVDVVNCANGGISTFAGGIGNVFRRCRVRDDYPLGKDGSNRPLHNRPGWNNDGVTNGEPNAWVTSTGLGFSATTAYDTQAVLEACKYFNLANQTVWPATATGNGWTAIDLTEEDFTPRAPIRLSFPGFATAVGKVVSKDSTDNTIAWSLSSPTPVSSLSVLSSGAIIGGASLTAPTEGPLTTNLVGTGDVTGLTGSSPLVVSKEAAPAAIESLKVDEPASTAPTTPNVYDATGTGGYGKWQIYRKEGGGFYPSGTPAYQSSNIGLDLTGQPMRVKARFEKLNAGGVGQAHVVFSHSSKWTLPFNGGTETGYAFFIERWGPTGNWWAKCRRYDGASAAEVVIGTDTMLSDSIDVAEITVDATNPSDIVVSCNFQDGTSFSTTITDATFRGPAASVKFNNSNAGYTGTVADRAHVTFEMGLVS